MIKSREIKAMILGCRGFYRRHMEDRRAELNPKAFNRCKEQVDECNDLLRLDYSSKNLKRLKQFKNDVYNKTYQEDLQKNGGDQKDNPRIKTACSRQRIC